MHEALQQVRFALGPDAAVLHTREVPRNVIQWLAGTRQVEVVASRDVNVPSRLPVELMTSPAADRAAARASENDDEQPTVLPIPAFDGREWHFRYRDSLHAEDGGLRSLVEELSRTPMLATEQAEGNRRKRTWNFNST
jgi:flagellar biosynthesis GTPase FlhF